METKSLHDLKKVRYWIDCGDDDYLTIGNCLLQIALIEKEFFMSFVSVTVLTTGHIGVQVTDALQFIGASFHQQ